MAVSNKEVLLIVCLTLFVSNLMCAGHFDESQIDSLKDAIIMIKAKLIIVSNETGLGVVPDNKLARQFRDAAGKLNQDVASIVDRFTFIVAGLPMSLKIN